MALTLSLSGITVKFDKFLDTDYPRTVIQNATLEFSVAGTPALSGSHFAPKHIWAVNAICDTQQRDAIELIAHEFHEKRRALQDSDILILDTTATIKERSPATRAVVGGTTVLTLNGGVHLAYFAQFKGILSENLKFSKTGKIDFVSFVLTETVRVPA